MEQNLEIVLILAVGFTLATLLGYLVSRVNLPTILAYLVAGYLIGPYSPGFVADKAIAEQLAEVGVILMLFGVGLHFKLEDLIKVKYIAIPGALIQTLAATCVTTLVTYSLGYPLHVGILLGFAIGVASTVVLVRVLTDNNLLNTIQGHISIGWLVVEDIFTVAVLLLLPLFQAFVVGKNPSLYDVSLSVLLLSAKFLLLVLIMFTIGQKAISYILVTIARMHSRELFTICVLALTFLIATGSSFIFGTSIALGAFIAGMVIGNTHAKHQAAANSLPLKDIFATLFFLSVGMLFDPIAIFSNLTLFFSLLLIILLVKPLAAFLLVRCFGFSLKIGITIALALSQIGEFSFILAEEAMNLELLPADCFDSIIACAFITISLNPLLFQLIDFFEEKMQKTKALKFIRAKLIEDSTINFQKLINLRRELSKIVVVGFGPIGEEVTYTVKQLGYEPIVIEQNIDTVSNRESEDLHIIYGDASNSHILETAKIQTASLLVITIPSSSVCQEIIHAARHLNPKIRILARVVYIADEKLMQELKVHYISSERETLQAFVTQVKNQIHGLLPKGS